MGLFGCSSVGVEKKGFMMHGWMYFQEKKKEKTSCFIRTFIYKKKKLLSVTKSVFFFYQNFTENKIVCLNDLKFNIIFYQPFARHRIYRYLENVSHITNNLRKKKKNKIFRDFIRHKDGVLFVSNRNSENLLLEMFFLKMGCLLRTFLICLGWLSPVVCLNKDS